MDFHFYASWAYLIFIIPTYVPTKYQWEFVLDLWLNCNVSVTLVTLKPGQDSPGIEAWKHDLEGSDFSTEFDPIILKTSNEPSGFQVWLYTCVKYSRKFILICI